MSYKRKHLLDLLAKAYAFDDESNHEKQQDFFEALDQVLADEPSADPIKLISHGPRLRNQPISSAQGIVVGGSNISFEALANGNMYHVVVEAKMTKSGLIVSGQLNGLSVANWERGTVLLYMDNRLEDYTELALNREFELTLPHPGTITLRFLDRSNAVSIESEPFEVILK